MTKQKLSFIFLKMGLCVENAERFQDRAPSLPGAACVKHLLAALHARHGLHVLPPVAHLRGENLRKRRKGLSKRLERTNGGLRRLVTLSCFTSSFFTDLRLALRSMEPLCLEPRSALIISSADTLTFLRAGFLNLPPKSWIFSFSSWI